MRNPDSPLTNNEMIKQIISFYDDSATAERILREHLRGSRITLDDGTVYHIIHAYSLLRTAYERRCVHNTPHRVSLLESFLSGSTRKSISYSARTIRYPNLEELESQVDQDAHYRGRYGVWKIY